MIFRQDQKQAVDGRHQSRVANHETKSEDAMLKNSGDNALRGLQMLPQFYAKSAFGSRAYRATASGLMLAALVAIGFPVAAAPIFFEVGGSAATSSIQATVDAFRAALGNPNNANAPGPLASGRREINWDGGGPPVDANGPGGTPFNVFRNTRGAQFITPGTGFLQAPPSGGPQGGLAGAFSNPTYGTTFGVFSPNRDFTPVGSNITDGLFFIPGTNGGTPATVSGFGVVFTDVDLAGITKIDFFDEDGNLLLSRFILPGTVPDASFSFLGVIFNAGEEISRVRITTGNAALAAGVNDGGGVDLVVMDDFLYAEPSAALAAVPEPASGALLGAAALAFFVIRHRRRAWSAER
jgi:PEP-CTERM motif